MPALAMSVTAAPPSQPAPAPPHPVMHVPLQASRLGEPNLPRPCAAAGVLRRRPLQPTSVGELLRSNGGYREFRRIVEEVFPDAAAELLATPARPGESCELARCWAFFRRVEAELFPCFECDEYEQVACGIPFVTNGWSYERFHELDLPAGELLLLALCEQPYLVDNGSRIALLDAAATHLPRDLLADVPPEGIHPAVLHERLDGTPFAAVAEFADWVWGNTGTVFLDASDETTFLDAEWTREIVQELAEQWQAASAILDRISALECWIERDPAVHFALLRNAALGRKSPPDYERERKWYACELTPDGLHTNQIGPDTDSGEHATVGPETRTEPADVLDPDTGPLPIPVGAAG